MYKLVSVQFYRRKVVTVITLLATDNINFREFHQSFTEIIVDSNERHEVLNLSQVSAQKHF